MSRPRSHVLGRQMNGGWFLTVATVCLLSAWPAAAQERVTSVAGAGSSIVALGLSDDHRATLETVAPVYRSRLWPEDDKRNRAWIDDVTTRLQRISARVLPQLEAFYRMPWYSSMRTARIDIVYVGDARGGYTWVYPEVHTVIDAGMPRIRDGSASR